MSDEEKPHMTELIRFEWIIPVTPTAHSHAYVRPAAIEVVIGERAKESKIRAILERIQATYPGEIEICEDFD